MLNNKRKIITTVLDVTLYQVTHKQLLGIAYSAVAITVVVALVGWLTGNILSNELLSLIFISYFASGLISEAGVSLLKDNYRAAILLLIYAIILSPFILLLSKGLIFFLG